MSKNNPLSSLIGNYGDSDDDSEDDVRGVSVVPETRQSNLNPAVTSGQNHKTASATVLPPPISHCAWSACYDETSGFTYYWNQQTNAVTWNAPPEYLLALKLAQQHLTVSGSAEVSAEEWQLYQQALAEKQSAQSKATVKPTTKANKKNERNMGSKNKNNKLNNKKRSHSDDEDEKIELITSYHNSDSESNDETENASKPAPQPVSQIKPKSNLVNKKPKLKTQEYGPTLAPNTHYSTPIGPELPPELSNNVAKSPEVNTKTANIKEEEIPLKPNEEDNQDESELLMKLKDKAKLLEKLGGEIPKELQKMINEESGSRCQTPKSDDSPKSKTNIDDLLDEIEKKELPKISKAKNLLENTNNENVNSAKNSPIRTVTPPLEHKPLFPSVANIDETPLLLEPKNIDKNEDKKEIFDKKGVNLYITDTNEHIDNVGKKKLRISNSVLPQKEPVYTTKYSQFIEGFSNERVGLGFSKEDVDGESQKTGISYGNGLVFTKGETLNEEKKEEDLNELTEVLELKLKYLNQLQPCVLTPVQEMLIQMQTLVAAYRSGALSAGYWRQWATRSSGELRAHERRAAPPGWLCAFQRSEGRYCYKRESDGLVQWEYPAITHTDMDISTTPPHPGIEAKEELEQVQPPLPPSPPGLRPPSPHTPPPPSWGDPHPTWADPPPPGCDDLPMLPTTIVKKQEIGEELASFYSDIAQLENTSAPQTASNSPELVEVKERNKEYREKEKERDRDRDRQKEREREKDRDGRVSKKKSKVKISERVGLKHKSVSSLVAKWQQVAEEIHSD